MKNTFGLERVRVYTTEKDAQDRVSKEKIGIVTLQKDTILKETKIKIEDNVIIEYINDITRKLKLKSEYVDHIIQTLNENGELIYSRNYNKDNELICTLERKISDNYTKSIITNKDDTSSLLTIQNIDIIKDKLKLTIQTNIESENSIYVQTIYEDKDFSVYVNSLNNNIKSAAFKYIISDNVSINVNCNCITVEYIKDEYKYKLYFDIQSFIQYICKDKEFKSITSVNDFLNNSINQICKFKILDLQLSKKVAYINQFNKPKSTIKITRNNLNYELKYNLNDLMLHQNKMTIKCKDCTIYFVSGNIVLEKEKNNVVVLSSRRFKNTTLELVENIIKNLEIQ